MVAAAAMVVAAVRLLRVWRRGRQVGCASAGLGARRGGGGPARTHERGDAEATQEGADRNHGCHTKQSKSTDEWHIRFINLSAEYRIDEKRDIGHSNDERRTYEQTHQ